MTVKELVKILRRWYIIDGELYCPQCWGKYLYGFDREGIVMVKEAVGDGNTVWARHMPICERCSRDARREGN